MISFEDYFLLHEALTYSPRIGDLFYHGSLGDFNMNDLISENGLAYVTRNIHHAMEYAAPRSSGFGSPLSESGFVYAFKVNPSANIFDATNDNNIKQLFGKNKDFMGGMTEIIQQEDIIDNILANGFDGVLQKQADLDQYGNLIPKSIKRYEYDKYDKTKEKWKKKLPLKSLDSGIYRGTVVLGIDPSLLVPFKKIPYMEVYDQLNIDKTFHKNIKS